MNVQELPIEALIPTPDNPRDKIDPADPAIGDLIESIRQFGILQPLIGRPHPTEEGRIDLRCGARRLYAAEQAGLSMVPVVVSDLTDLEAMLVTITENKDRADLRPVEEARGIGRLRDLGYPIEEVAAKLGKSVSWVARRARLTALSPDWQTFAAAHNPSVAHLELIARLDEAGQAEVFEDINRDASEFFTGPGSLGALHGYLARRTRELRLAFWSLDDAALCPTAGACLACPKRSSAQPELWDDTHIDSRAPRGDRCLDPRCWEEKRAAALARKEAELRAKHPGLVRFSQEYSTEKGVLHAYQAEAVNKNTPGAVPAMRIDGKAAGALMWVKPYHQDTPAARKAKAAANPRAALADQRAQLECRRWAFVINKLTTALLERKCPMPVDEHYASTYGLCELVAIFGTGFQEADITGFRPDDFESLKVVAKKPELALRAVWDRVRPKLIDAVRFYKTGDVGEAHIAAAHHIASLLGANIKAMKADADAEIPEPKAWAALAPAAKAKKGGRKAK